MCVVAKSCLTPGEICWSGLPFPSPTVLIRNHNRRKFTKMLAITVFGGRAYCWFSLWLLFTFLCFQIFHEIYQKLKKKHKLELITNRIYETPLLMVLRSPRRPRRPGVERPWQEVFIGSEPPAARMRARGEWAQLRPVMDRAQDWHERNLIPAPALATHSRWVLEKACSFSIRRILMPLAASENWQSGRGNVWDTAGGKAIPSAALSSCPPSEFPLPGGGPLCSVYTPGPGAKGGLEGGSQTICGIIPASRQQATGKPSKKYQKPSALSVIT